MIDVVNRAGENGSEDFQIGEDILKHTKKTIHTFTIVDCRRLYTEGARTFLWPATQVRVISAANKSAIDYIRYSIKILRDNIFDTYLTLIMQDKKALGLDIGDENNAA